MENQSTFHGIVMPSQVELMAFQSQQYKDRMASAKNMQDKLRTESIYGFAKSKILTVAPIGVSSLN